MSFGFVAFHYPAPEHVEEFVGGCHQVIEAGQEAFYDANGECK